MAESSVELVAASAVELVTECAVELVANGWAATSVAWASDGCLQLNWLLWSALLLDCYRLL